MSEMERNTILSNTQACSEEEISVMLTQIPSRLIMVEIFNRLEELETLKQSGRELFGV